VTRRQRALRAVAEDDDREPLPDGYAGACERCGRPIIAEPGKRPGAPRLYCSRGCGQAAHVARMAA